MTIVASILVGLIQSASLDTDSASGFFNSMPMYSAMYINGTDLQKEIKRTPKGYLIRDVNEQATIVHQRNAKGQKEIRIRSNKEWTLVQDPQVLINWFQQMDEKSGDRARCNFQGNAYVMSMNGHFISIADDTCEWSGSQSLSQLFNRPDEEEGSVQYIVALGE